MYDCHVWMLWARYGNVWTSHVSQNYVMFTVLDFSGAARRKTVHTCSIYCFRSSTSRLIPSNFTCIYLFLYCHVVPRVFKGAESLSLNAHITLTHAYNSVSFFDPALRTCIVFYLYCRKHKSYRKSLYVCMILL